MDDKLIQECQPPPRDLSKVAGYTFLAFVLGVLAGMLFMAMMVYGG